MSPPEDTSVSLPTAPPEANTGAARAKAREAAKAAANAEFYTNVQVPRQTRAEFRRARKNNVKVSAKLKQTMAKRAKHARSI